MIRFKLYLPFYNLYLLFNFAIKIQSDEAHNCLFILYDIIPVCLQ